MGENDSLLVLAASYDSLEAAVIVREPGGEVKVAKKHEQPTRHGATHGLGWGLAVGAAFAIFPAIGLVGGLAAGGAAGATIGAVKGHVKGGLNDEDLKQLGTVLEQGQAGVIVVYARNMADQVAATIKAMDKYVSKELDADADALNKQLQQLAPAS